MIDPAKLAAFALLTALTSAVPGPQVLFTMSQSIWQGPRKGAAALAGLQLGNLLWFVMAGLGLGTLAKAAPLAFTGLAVLGACYLAWLGLSALRHAGEMDSGPDRAQPRPTHHALRDGIIVAISNPKSLVYVVALLPPFINQAQPVIPQVAVLAAVAIGIDTVIGIAYIALGSALSKAMARHGVRLWLDRTVGALFIAIAIAVIASVYGSGA